MLAGLARKVGQSRPLVSGAVQRRLPTVVPAAASSINQTRNYRHWFRATPDEFELPSHSMPLDIKDILADPNKREFDYLDHYWYWRVRKESTVLNPERLVKLTYKQLAYDMGMPVVGPALEHQMGLIELYEYLKSSPFIGPFGTIENPCLIPAIGDNRAVGCTGGTGDNEHYPLWFNCREGFLYRCGECDQIFMLVRITYGNSWVDESFVHHKEIFAKDPDVDDVFDINLLTNAHKRWNEKDMLRWSLGAQALGCTPVPEDQTEYKMVEVVRGD
jgi:cytochrome c oxidase subunit 5b